jgi:hypothetical protein
MHHPIWKYNTDGRFQELEAALSARPHTVIAGHEHHYHHHEKNGRNYYILATTGGGSAIRGNYFGEFDHVTWVTMTGEGPAMANLRLDGILPHDIAGDATNKLARAMLENTAFSHVLLCNEGPHFKNGTLYFNFRNSGTQPLSINLRFYHQHQLAISNPSVAIDLEPGNNKTIEIPFHAEDPLSYDDIEALQIDWIMKYDLPEYPGFQLSGQYDVRVTPTKTNYVRPTITKFIDQLEIESKHPFSNLTTHLEILPDGSPSAKEPDGSNFTIHKSSRISLKIKNEEGQSTMEESVHYEKCQPQKATKLRKPKSGLEFQYYEGTWEKIPDFSNLKALKTGIMNDWLVGDVAMREDQFAVVLTGYFYAPKEGMYVFRTRSDDASRLLINNEVVVNQDLDPKNSFGVGAIALQTGYHKVTIQFLERFGNERLRVYLKNQEGDNWNYLELENNFYH